MKKVLLVLVVCLSLGACGQPEGNSPAPGKQEAQVWLNKGLEEFQKSGGIDQAIASFQKASELDPRSAAAYDMLGQAYLLKSAQTKDQGLKEKSRAAFQKAIEVDPNYWPALINLGSTYFAGGDKARAVPLFKKALTLNPQHPWKARLEKMIAEGEGKAQAPPPPAAPSPSPFQPPQPPLASAQSPEARSAPKGGELMKEEAFTALVKGYDLFRAGKYEAAEEKFKEALKADPHNPFALNNVAALKERQGKPGEAMGILVPALYYAIIYNDKLTQDIFPRGLTAAAKPLRELGSTCAIAVVVTENRRKLASKLPPKSPRPPQSPSPPSPPAPRH
jgi:tetratricopeptide (TPR) repeat protein